PAGVITDRISHRPLMVWSDLFRFVLGFAVIALIFMGPDLPAQDPARWLILGLAAIVFCLGTAEVLHDNTAQTILPTLIDAVQLPRANGIMASAEQVIGQFIGPPLAGFLIALALPLPFWLDAISFLLAALLIMRLKPRVYERPPPQPVFAAMREGLVWIFKRPILVRLAVITGLMNLGATIYLTILVLFAQDILGLGAAEYGLLLTAGAAGGAVGGLVAPRLIDVIGAGWGLRLGVALIFLESLLIGLAHHPFTVALSLFTGMFGGMVWNVISVPLRQRIVPPELLGRVNSVYRFFAWGMIPAGALLAGILVRLVEPFASHETALRFPYFAVAGLFALLAVYTFLRFSNASVARESAVDQV
ncbi:MAG TPA: MFS transporter, partial [Aliiroseovarius sp.]|nr:MFS transporter [Aliiroseovarius sp.]